MDLLLEIESILLCQRIATLLAFGILDLLSKYDNQTLLLVFKNINGEIHYIANVLGHPSKSLISGVPLTSMATDV